MTHGTWACNNATTQTCLSTYHDWSTICTSRNQLFFPVLIFAIHRCFNGMKKCRYGFYWGQNILHKQFPPQSHSNLRIQENTGEYKGIQENTGEYKRIQKNTEEYKGIQENTGECTGNVGEFNTKRIEEQKHREYLRIMYRSFRYTLLTLHTGLTLILLPICPLAQTYPCYQQNGG